MNDLEGDVRLALQVGYLHATGDFSRAEIARLTKAAPADLRKAYERLARVLPTIDRDTDE